MGITAILKAGDTAPIITDALTWDDGTAVDLTPATSLQFVARSTRTGRLVTGTAISTAPATGAIQYSQQSTDFPNGDERLIFEWLVTWSSGQVQRFPTAGFNEVIVNPNATSGSLNYADLSTFKLSLGINTAVSDKDALMMQALSAASRAIDQYCGRHFYMDPVLTAKTFEPDDLLFLDLGQDIASTTGLKVETDAAGDGVYETTWLSSDFQLLPQNAPTEAVPHPWTKLRAVGGKTFPWLINVWLTRRDRVRVTAYWGWPQVPDDVAEACLIKAGRLYSRKDSPQGIAGFGEFGPIRISNREDPDVCSILGPYRRDAVLVG